MSSESEKIQLKMYNDDPRIPCQYGIKCYQKNSHHHSKYKHPPEKETVKQKNEIFITGAKGKDLVKDNKKAKSENPPKKLQKIHEKNVHNLSSSSESDEDDDKNSNTNIKVTDKDVIVVQKAILNEYDCSSNSAKLDTSKNLSVSVVNARQIIKELFLVEMPQDFYQFYEFCKEISQKNPLLAFKSVCLKLVGPYDVLKGKIKNSISERDKEKYLLHWRYYYDPPEFQTIIKCEDIEGLHFGYWRDDITEKPVFVAKNCRNVSCVFESVAENIFGAVDTYLESKVKSANPFNQTNIIRLRFKLIKFAKQHKITLEKNTIHMRSRERKVVARTFHKAGIVVPYDRRTQLGYRDLATSDNELQKILKLIEEVSISDKKNMAIAELDEIIRLATIAADECDFGTCLELGHDLFSNGSIHMQDRALQMLSIAYTHLQRPQLLKILKVHLKNRRESCELSVIEN